MTDLILGIESSCDDTAASVVRAGREILSSVVHTQAAEHAPFGGVVPEIAGRSHLRSILPVIDEALDQAGVQLDQLAGIAVTHRPGLVGSLLVGLSAAKALAFARNLPLVGVHHIEAHVYAATIKVFFTPPPRNFSGASINIFEAKNFQEIRKTGRKFIKCFIADTS